MIIDKSNKNRSVMKKMPKTDTLDALDDAMTTILTTWSGLVWSGPVWSGLVGLV